MSSEEWRDWPECPDRYKVSDLGNVKSKSFLKAGTNRHGGFSYMTRERGVAPFVNRQGYTQVRLFVGGEKVTRRVHRMVAQTFLLNPNYYPVVNHINSLRSDNRAENLEWCTIQENVCHSFSSGNKSNSGELHPKYILKEQDILNIKILGMQGIRPSSVAKMLSLEYHKVSKVLSRKNWKRIEPEGSGWHNGQFTGDEQSEKDLQLEACNSS